MGKPGKFATLNNSHWEIYTGDSGEIIYQLLPGSGTGWSKRNTHRPITHDPTTGKLETFWRRKGTLDFITMHRGWIQRSWPRVLKDGCPDLDLPADLPINEKQTAREIEALRAQDPEAPITAFTTKQIHESFFRFWIGNHGKIVTADIGSSHESPFVNFAWP